MSEIHVLLASDQFARSLKNQNTFNAAVSLAMLIQDIFNNQLTFSHIRIPRGRREIIEKCFLDRNLKLARTAAAQTLKFSKRQSKEIQQSYPFLRARKRP